MGSKNSTTLERNPTCYEGAGRKVVVNQFGESCHVLQCSGMDLRTAELKVYKKGVERWDVTIDVDFSSQLTG